MMREGARQGAIGMASDVVAGLRGDPLPVVRGLLDTITDPTKEEL
jgi:hypothetical protein